MAPEHQAAVLDLDEDAWTRLTDAVYGFEEAWRAGTASAIGRFLPPPDDPLRPQILAELIKVDRERRWEAGESRVLEAYLADWPELRENAEAIAGLLEAECATRTSFDATPTLADLAARFPTICERIDLARVAAEVDADRSVPPDEDGRIPERLVDVSGGIAAIHRGSDRSPVLVAGARLGRYEIRKQLGRGGMATVYKATDSQLGREIALKIPRFEPDTEHAVIERFLREAKAAASVDHPNVCPVYDAGEIGGTAYIAMRFVSGRSLANVIADGPLPVRDAVMLVRKLADALVAVHAAGVIHRDIKASSVLLTGDGEPFLTDFGLSRPRHTADTQHLTTTGSPIGTPAYMSPEQVHGDHAAIDARTDIYSLGVLLYQLLTGRLPFEGPLTEVLIAIKQVEPPRPGTLRPEIDRELDAICRKAMAKRPANRYQTAHAFADALDAYLRTTPEERRRRERRRQTLTVCLGIVAAVLIAAIVVPCVRYVNEFTARHRDRLASGARFDATAQSPEPTTPTASPCPAAAGERTGSLGPDRTVRCG
jgi:serine/threonine protein kinase